MSKKPVAIRAKKNLTLYKDSALKQKSGSMAKKSYSLVSKLSKNADGVPVLTVPKLYQNPKKYHQIHYTRVKPYGQVGYTVSRGFEGIKTYLIMKRLGTYNGYNYYNNATWYAGRRFQASHHLKVTGNVDQTKLGLGKKLFKQIDSYTVPLGAQAWKGRKAHIEAMIRLAYKYMGHPYLVGSSSMTRYGTDCSGLVIQSLYAGGISPVPVSAIGHAHPGNEWNSRNLWADKKLKRVSYASRRRGDLVFYYQPGTRTIWHVAIYLGNNMVIESWPPRIMVQLISNSQRNVIAGIKRPFL
ncbi:C40 family peptidase [Lactobacillus delbrueckii]|uniref:C40 family peptidase n=1 Tax=Lactobacillus delbrueckii TaxID=1584 RepID=UPI00398FC05A